MSWTYKATFSSSYNLGVVTYNLSIGTLVVSKLRSRLSLKDRVFTVLVTSSNPSSSWLLKMSICLLRNEKGTWARMCPAIAHMYVYVTQANFTTNLVLKLKISEVSQKWIPKAVELKRIPTHKKCKCKKFCSQTRLVGEIYSSDVIMHRGYCFGDRYRGHARQLLAIFFSPVLCNSPEVFANVRLV